MWRSAETRENPPAITTATNENEHAAASQDDLDDPAPNLEVIYAAYGELADLYKDVLQVKPSATAEQIQMAYFDRRSELFALLASIDSEEEQDDITASHRFHAERKMDAVVMAVRILGDEQLRQEYDNVMILKTAPKVSNKTMKEPTSVISGGASREPDGVYAGVGVTVPPSPNSHHNSPKKNKRRPPKRRSPRHVGSPVGSEFPDDCQSERIPSPVSSSDEAMYRHADPDYEFVSPARSKGSSKASKGNKKSKSKYQPVPPPPPPPSLPKFNVDDSFEPQTEQIRRKRDEIDDSSPMGHDESTLDRTWDDDATFLSDDWTYDDTRRGHSTALSAVTSTGFVSRIQEEVAGTFEDTLVSFEQVLNAFTLQDRDIQAVMGRIDKAKRQLRKRN